MINFSFWAKLNLVLNVVSRQENIWDLLQSKNRILRLLKLRGRWLQDVFKSY